MPVFFPPELGELKVSEITDSSAMVSCNVLETYELDVQECGFLYYLKDGNSNIHYLKADSHNSFSTNIWGLLPEKEYVIKAYAKNVAGIGYSDLFSFETLHNAGTIPFDNGNDTIQSGDDSGVCNGHAYVDLGLPSGILWATCNVGAISPDGYGNYYAWGETSTKEVYSRETYTYLDNPYILPSSADAATINWGTGWRMPTKEEMNELVTNCTHVWTTRNGVRGSLFTGPNGKSIFLPAVGYRHNSELGGFLIYGYYWSSSLDPDGTNFALALNFSTSGNNMYSYYRFYGQSVRPVCSQQNPTTDDLPTVQTFDATNVGTTSATLNGYVSNAGNNSITASGFVYGTNASNLTQNVSGGIGIGNLSETITGLTFNTTYYYKAYATNSVGTALGELKQFTTTAINAPSVSTISATSITTNSATLNGNVTSDGGSTVTSRGFVYGTSSDNFSCAEECGSGTGVFNKTISALSPGTTYYYKAFAVNNAGRVFGEVKQFTTTSVYAPTVSTVSATSITTNSATLNGNVTSDGGSTVTSRGFVYGTNSSNLSVLSGSGTGSYNRSITGLAAGTTYYYKACATNSVGTAYGEVKQFTTASICASTVSTVSASSITNNSATLYGNVTSDGGATVTSRGFVYGTSSSNLSQNIQSDSGTGSYFKTITGLTSGTTYYYKAYATNSSGTSYGSLLSFVTNNDFYYDFESCTAWTVDQFSPCTTYDGDGLATWEISGATFTNSGYTGSYIAFENGTANGFNAHGGTKFGCCIDAINGQNNDWFILPQIYITNGTKFSFWARSAIDQYGLEQFRVAVSTNNNNYTYIAGSSDTSVSAPVSWTRFTYDLSQYAGQTLYIAIICVSNDSFAFFIDDIYVGQN